MNRRNIKLISTTLSILVAISLLVLGVYSLAERTVSISGTINFTTTDASFIAKIYKGYGQGENVADIVYETDPFATVDFRERGVEVDGEVKLGEININDATNIFAFRVEFVNNEEFFPLKIEFEINTPSGDWITLTSDNAFESSDTKYVGTGYAHPSGHETEGVKTISFMYVANGESIFEGEQPIQANFSVSKVEVLP